MKKQITIVLIFVISLILSMSLTAQESNKIVFPREWQAQRQAVRLSIHHYGVTPDGDLTYKSHKKTESGYSIDIDCSDLDLRHGAFNRLVIKKRHYKYIQKREKIFFNLDNCGIEYRKSKFQKFITKLRK